MPSRAQAERAWIVGSGQQIFALNDGGGGADQAGVQNVLISGADLVDDTSLTLGKLKSDWFCERLMFRMYCSFSKATPVNVSSKRVYNHALLTASIADQVSYADTLVGPRVNADLYDSNTIWWTASNRILQQDCIPAYFHGTAPQANGPGSWATTTGLTVSGELSSVWGPPVWDVDLKTRFSLDEDTDLVLVTVAPPASLDSSFQNGDSFFGRYVFKSLWRKRRE